jgi:hypothetical protein
MAMEPITGFVFVCARAAGPAAHSTVVKISAKHLVVVMGI